MNVRSKTPFQAFTRLDVAASVAVVAVFLLLKLSVLANSKQTGQGAVCQNNLRQLGQAALMYCAENESVFPERAPRPFWPERLHPYFGAVDVLRCPSDGPNPRTFGSDPSSPDAAPRSYIFNGFNDYFRGIPTNHATVPEAAIGDPAGTILLGEKATASGHFWMDYWAYDDISELDQRRHFHASSVPASGGAYYAFADGSSRYLPFPRCITPTNLWGITELLRNPPWP